jgi:hypothetical protein
MYEIELHFEEHVPVEFWELPVLHVVTCDEHFTFLLLCLFLDDSSSGACVSCSRALPNTAGITKNSAHFSKQKESQKMKSLENLQESVKPKCSCE